MKKILAGFCLLIGLTVAAAAQANADEQAVIKIENEMTASGLKGDKSVMEKYLAPGYFETGPDGTMTKREKVLSDFNPLPASSNASLTYSDYMFEQAGDVVILNAKGTFKADVNGTPINEVFRVTHVWKKDSGGWHLLAEQATDIPVAPPVAKVDPTVYDAYVGEYDFSSDIRVFLTRDGNRLMFRGVNEKEATELLPVDDHTFFLKADPRGRVVFERDAQGKVIGITSSSGDGQQWTAKKVK